MRRGYRSRVKYPEKKGEHKWHLKDRIVGSIRIVGESQKEKM
jgi:hypothetical protein